MSGWWSGHYSLGHIDSPAVEIRRTSRNLAGVLLPPNISPTQSWRNSQGKSHSLHRHLVPENISNITFYTSFFYISFQFVTYKIATYNFHQTIKHVRRRDITYFHIKKVFQISRIWQKGANMTPVKAVVAFLLWPPPVVVLLMSWKIRKKKNQ